ncbi:hypothetical protein BDV96DRAFT_569943 [Lophiotrema nucula]|uniref:Uncharacterized protein n=1 Tax=Lophiotrema nucula TaxID=690887 RepID=A0A6A5ZG42_9PLEO|nr:hypothetical protein BDV96DRAFT_569943 [Lophiotrema nucula]
MRMPWVRTPPGLSNIFPLFLRLFLCRNWLDGGGGALGGRRDELHLADPVSAEHHHFFALISRIYTMNIVKYMRD